MPIVSVTRIAGTKRSGKSFIASVLNTKPSHYIVDDSVIRTKQVLHKLFDDWKIAIIDPPCCFSR